MAYKKTSVIFREMRLPISLYYTDCKFYPSCSDYAIKAISRHGAVKGSVKILGRVFRCSPFSEGGIDLP